MLIALQTLADGGRKLAPGACVILAGGECCFALGHYGSGWRSRRSLHLFKMFLDVREPQTQLHADGVALPIRSDPNEREIRLAEGGEPPLPRRAHRKPTLAYADRPGHQTIAVVPVPRSDGANAWIPFRGSSERRIRDEDGVELVGCGPRVVIRPVVVRVWKRWRGAFAGQVREPRSLQRSDRAGDLAGSPSNAAGPLVRSDLLERAGFAILEPRDEPPRRLRLRAVRIERPRFQSAEADTETTRGMVKRAANRPSVTWVSVPCAFGQAVEERVDLGGDLVHARHCGPKERRRRGDQ